MYDGPIVDTHHHIWVVKNYSVPSMSCCDGTT